MRDKLECKETLSSGKRIERMVFAFSNDDGDERLYMVLKEYSLTLLKEIYRIKTLRSYNKQNI